MASNSNNLSKQGIQDVYRALITKFDNEGKDVSVLRNRLSKLTLRDKKKDRLILAEELLRNVIKDVEDFQDVHGMSTNLYYTIKEFLSE